MVDGVIGDAENIIATEHTYGPNQPNPYYKAPDNVVISDKDARTVKKIFDNYIWPW
jgi:hypothetical protein